MNKEYALEIIQEVECGMLYATDHLAREAACYLMRLVFKKKNTTQADNDIYDRCYRIKYNTRK